MCLKANGMLESLKKDANGRFDAPLVSLNDWLVSKAVSLEKRNLKAEAVSCWRKLLDRQIFEGASELSSAEVHFRIGCLQLELGNRIKAVFHFRSAIRLDPKRAAYFEAFGRCFLLSGHWRIAKHQFEKALRLDGTSQPLWAVYAWTTLKSGETHRALKISDKVLASQSANEECFLYLAQILSETGQWSKLSALIKKWKAAQKGAPGPVLKRTVDECRRRYRLCFQGAVHQFIRKRAPVDGQPFTLKDLRVAEAVWLKFCQKQSAFANRRASLRLTKVWAAASYASLLAEEDEEGIERLARRFIVKSHEIRAARGLLKSFR